MERWSKGHLFYYKVKINAIRYKFWLKPFPGAHMVNGLKPTLLNKVGPILMKGYN